MRIMLYEMAKSPFTLRLDPAVVDRLERLARRRGSHKTPLAERLLGEAIRMAEHPGILFRDGAAGRYPAIIGHRLKVRHVIETLRAENGDVEAAAGYLSLPVGLVQAAIGYYADYQDEVDEEIRASAELAGELEATWRRQQAAIGR
jgi:uncharacterized protein (DUF433 family)